jgi:hypothetical protein
MATEVPSPILSVSLAAMASGREASCFVSLVQRPTKPRASAAREVSPTFRRQPALGPEARVQLHLRDEDELPGSLASLEVAVGLGCLRERVGAADADLEGVVADPG